MFVLFHVAKIVVFFKIQIKIKNIFSKIQIDIKYVFCKIHFLGGNKKIPPSPAGFFASSLEG